MPKTFLTEPLLQKIDPTTVLGGSRAPNGRLELWDSLLENFGYRATRKGTGSFFVMYRLAGERRRMTIGQFPSKSLDAARNEAIDVLNVVLEGKDPRSVGPDGPAVEDAARLARDEAEEAAKQRQFQVVTKSFVLRYLRGVAKGGSPKDPPNRKSWRETQRIFDRYVLPSWGDRDIAAIRRRDVARLLNAVMTITGRSWPIARCQPCASCSTGRSSSRI